MKDYYDSSWAIVDKETEKRVLETFDFELCQFVNISKYKVVPIMKRLQSLNVKRK